MSSSPKNQERECRLIVQILHNGAKREVSRSTQTLADHFLVVQVFPCRLRGQGVSAEECCSHLLDQLSSGENKI